jgi:hypothetical protein
MLEAINSLGNLRGRALIRYVEEMVGTPQRIQLYSHPLIEALKKPNFRLRGKSTSPSYIPARAFVTALIEVIRPVAANGPLTYANLRAAVVGLPPAQAALSQALLPLIDNVNNDLDEARASIEKWYDQVMERATGWYKRHCMVALGIVGLLFAAGFNIDSIDLARRLMASADLRSQFEATAQYIRQDEKHAAVAVRAAAVQLLPGTATSPLMQEDRSLSEMNSTDQAATLQAARNVLAANVASNAYFSAAWTASHADISSAAWMLARAALSTARVTANEPVECPEEPPVLKDGHAQWCGFIAVADKQAEAWKAAEKEMDSLRVKLQDPRKKADIPANRDALGAARNKVRDIAKPVAEAFWAQSYMFPDAAMTKAVSAFLNEPSNQTLVGARKAIYDATDQISLVQRSLASSQPGFDPFKRDYIDNVEQPFWPTFWTYVWTQTKRLFTGDLPLFGWFLTALMISMGAPFWYDLIGKVANVRGSGGKPSQATDNEP